jgi:competence ComEA-like helix-hairpin-helix protein
MKKKSILILVVLTVVFLFAGISLAADEKGKINLNTATADQLAKIPGLNKDLAKKLIDQRKKNGEFVDMEELLDVKGISKDLVNNLKKYLFIKPASGCNC